MPEKRSQKTVVSFGNDKPEHLSSYERDYGPETKIFDAFQQPPCRPSTPANVLPVIDRDPRQQFLTSTRQHFDHYNHSISSNIYKTCVGESAATKEFHSLPGNIFRFDEKLPLLTRSSLDYRATKIVLPHVTPRLLNALKRSPTYSKISRKPSERLSEAMHAFQWPSNRRLKPTFVRRDSVIDKQCIKL